MPGTLTPGTAARISTGALVPAGADAVILQEDITRDGDSIALTGDAPNPPGKHIRREGLDFRLGDLLLPAGTCIGPAQLGLAITAGHSQIAVRRRPRIAIIDSGDELASGGEGLRCAPDPGQQWRDARRAGREPALHHRTARARRGTIWTPLPESSPAPNRPI